MPPGNLIDRLRAVMTLSKTATAMKNRRLAQTAVGIRSDKCGSFARS